MKEIVFDFKRDEDFNKFNDQVLSKVRSNFKDNTHQGSVVESDSMIKVIIDKM